MRLLIMSNLIFTYTSDFVISFDHKYHYPSRNIDYHLHVIIAEIK